MNRSPDVLALLRWGRAFVPAGLLAANLGMTERGIRTTVGWLGQMGYEIEARRGKGYRLVGAPDRLYPWEIERHLSTSFIGRQIVYRDAIDSTNALAFSLAASGCAEGTCVIAETQNAGRGRLRRIWHSPHGKNIYLSCVLRPALSPTEVSPLAFISCLAAADTVRSSGLEPRLKWPNDVLLADGRKVCGTLVEVSAASGAVRFVIIGIGMNVNMAEEDMGGEVAERATSLFLGTGNRFERARVCGMLLNNLEKYYGVATAGGIGEICRLFEERARIRGAYMEVVQEDRVYRGVSEGIADDGALLLMENGTTRRVIAGDVST